MMITLIEKFVSIVYRYNKKQDKDIAYFGMLTHLVTILGFYLFGLTFLFKATWLLPDSGSKVTDGLQILLICIPLYIGFWLLLPQKKVMEIESKLSEREYKYGKILFLIFYFLSAAIMLLIIYFSKHN